MRKLNKGQEPQSLTDWKRRNPSSTYRDLQDAPQVREAIRQACLNEQCHLCAYCCVDLKSSDGRDCHNEHVESQHLAPNKTLDFSNIVASCNVRGQCGDAHKNKPLPLTPFMDECETELQFMLSGLVEGNTDRAREMIEILNLGSQKHKNRRLISQRKEMINSLIYTHYGDLESFALEDDETLEIFFEELKLPNDGKLQAFSPVLINILKQSV